MSKRGKSQLLSDFHADSYFPRQDAFTTRSLPCASHDSNCSCSKLSLRQMPTYATATIPHSTLYTFPCWVDSSIAILCLENPVFSDPSIRQLPSVQDQNRPRGAGLACRNRLSDAYAMLRKVQVARGFSSAYKAAPASPAPRRMIDARPSPVPLPSKSRFPKQRGLPEGLQVACAGLEGNAAGDAETTLRALATLVRLLGNSCTTGVEILLGNYRVSYIN